LPIAALAYFMKIRSGMKNNESEHVMTIDEAISYAGETTLAS
jgi:hypothetical protein